jgi:hypothetical protein
MKLTNPGRFTPGGDNVGTALRNRPALIEATWRDRQAALGRGQPSSDFR